MQKYYGSHDNYPKSTSWLIEDSSLRQRTVRKFINPAIYVEKELVGMPPMRKTSQLTVLEECDEASDKKIKTASTCTNLMNDDKSSSESSDHSAVQKEPINSELYLSLSGLSSHRLNLNDNGRKEAVKDWLARKETELKRKSTHEIEQMKKRENEKQLILEKERENFKKWLHEKKEEEKRKEEQKLRQLEDTERKDIEKQQRKMINDENFKLWLRNKKKCELEKKIADKMDILKMYQESEKRMVRNEQAYHQWLKNSRNKPKPIPMNQGIRSLCSSESVSYINPIPWNPNVE